MGSPVTGDALFVVGAGCTVVGFILDRLIHPGRRADRALKEFLEDWRGEPERPGVDRRPGVMERLKSTEDLTQLIDKRTEQLERNSGTSMADAVHRTERKVDENRAVIEARIEQMLERIAEARRVAGEAAISTAKSQDEHRRDHDRLVDELADMRDRIWQRLEEIDVKFEERTEREKAYISMLHELGIDVELPAPPARPAE